MSRGRKRSRPVLLWKGKKVGTVTKISYEQEYPHDMLYHPSPAIQRFKKMIEEENYNPSRRKQREYKQIMDEIDDSDLDNENDT